MARQATVEPGVLNADVSKAARPYGLYYAPDPSSQQVCSMGGNVAENSGGAHCLKYGFTVTPRASPSMWYCPTGRSVTLGDPKPTSRSAMIFGGLFIGSEGTLGIT